MPQLPSGRHIAIQLDPLDALLNDVANPGNVHRIMAIKDLASLAPYVRILFLVPEGKCLAAEPPEEFREGSLPRPPGLVVTDSGYTLARLDELNADWSDEDKQAFQAFLDDRCQELFALGLSHTERARQWLLHESGMPARLLALWYQAGCHPCQEEGWAESDTGSPEWDSYDMLAALGQLAVLLPQHPETVEQLGHAHDRLQGMWACLRDTYPIPQGWPSLEMDVRDCANAARSEGWLSAIPAEKQDWLHRQCVIECVNLWNAYGDGFRGDFPRQYGIIELVVVSPEANACFER